MAEKTKIEKTKRGPWRGEKREFLLRVTPDTPLCQRLHEVHGTVTEATQALADYLFLKGWDKALDEKLKADIAQRHQAEAEAKTSDLTTEQLEEILAKRRAGGGA